MLDLPDLENSKLLDVYRVSEYPEVHDLADRIWGIIDLPRSQVDTAKKRYANKTLVCNLLDCHRLGKCLVCSRSRDDYTRPARYGALHMSYKVVVPLLDAYERAGITGRKRGYCYEGVSKYTRVWLAAEGRSLFDSLPQQAVAKRDKLPEIIMLKDPKKRLIDYQDTDATMAQRKQLTDYNDLISTCSIEYQPTDLRSVSSPCSDSWSTVSSTSTSNYYYSITRIAPRASCELYRVFNNASWEQGGRFYGAEYQGFSPSQRATITIDGRPTVELDFKGMQPRMAHHLMGHDVKGELYWIYPDPESKAVVKQAMLCCFGAASYRMAQRSVQEAVNFDPVIARSLVAAGVTVKQLLADISERHEAVLPMMFCGQAVYLQYRDSQIAADVMQHFTAKGIPVLVVHDSFIVPRDYANELETIMAETYYKHLDFDCPIAYKPEVIVCQ